MLIWISHSYYSHPKFEVLIVSILNNMYTWCCQFRISIIQHIYEAPNKYESHTNTIILTWGLCVCFACCVCLFLFSFLENSTATKAINFDKWFESFELFMCIMSTFLNLWIWMSRRMNRTYFKCYEFDVNVHTHTDCNQWL